MAKSNQLTPLPFNGLTSRSALVLLLSYCTRACL